MSNFYSTKTVERTVELVGKQFHVSPDYARRLAVRALNGIEAHGCDPEDWPTVVATVNVVVDSWVKAGTFKDEVS